MSQNGTPYATPCITPSCDSRITYYTVQDVRHVYVNHEGDERNCIVRVNYWRCGRCEDEGTPDIVVVFGERGTLDNLEDVRTY